MNSDQKFLRDAHIEPCDIRTSNWMEWREEELSALRFANMQQAVWLRGMQADKQRWKIYAVLGWVFAAMLFSIPIISRIGQ
jgi:hypothetical protein